jgi:hypothetical protein
MAATDAGSCTAYVLRRIAMPTGKKAKKHKASLKSGKKLEATKPLKLTLHSQVNNGEHLKTGRLYI